MSSNEDEYDDNDDLLCAILVHDFDSVRDLIFNGASIHKRYMMPNSSTLHAACGVDGTSEIVSLLIDFNADVGILDTHSKTPLHTAAEYGSTDVVRVLLNKRAEINAVDDHGDTPLMCSIMLRNHINMFFSINSIETIRMLIDNNANLQQANNYESTPLHEAVDGEQMDVVMMLLQKEIEIDPLDIGNRTPLNLAIKEDYTDIAEELLKSGANANQYNNDLSVTIPDTFGIISVHDLSTPLHEAAMCGNEDMIEILVRHGAFIGALDNEGCTPLSLAIRNNHAGTVAKLQMENELQIQYEKMLYLAIGCFSKNTKNLSSLKVLDHETLRYIHDICIENQLQKQEENEEDM